MLFRLLSVLLCFYSVIVLNACKTHHSDPDPVPIQQSTQPSSIVGKAQLNITPIAQQTQEWCWAATAEMVFRAYGMPSLNPTSYQCGIVAAYFGGVCIQQCGLCSQSIQGMSDMYHVLQGYGPFARQNGISSPVLNTRLSFRPLSLDEVKTEIDAGRPIVAGISAGSFPYPNFSTHATLIVGYDVTGPVPILVINDPFPYDLPQFVFQGNPYLTLGGAVEVQPGRFLISYAAFTGPMAWGNSIDQIQAQ